MRTKRVHYFDVRRKMPVYGVAVLIGGYWYNVVEDGVPALFEDRAAAESFRKTLRYEPEIGGVPPDRLGLREVEETPGIGDGLGRAAKKERT